MRQFTEAEKRQLQIKIDDQERKHRIVREIVRKGKKSEDNRPNWNCVEMWILGDNSLSAWL